MFNIMELVLTDNKNAEYSYKFSSGINFFRGKNSSGKTVFYELIDYMLGSSDSLHNKEWYSNLKEVSIKINLDNKKFILTRTKDIDENYISTLEQDFQNRHPISLETYKIKLGNIFTTNQDILADIKTFTDETLTYRTFTMFNFLGENSQGLSRYFLDKCSDVKYAIKLNSVLNFIFNNHQKEISELKEKLKTLQEEYDALNTSLTKYNFLKSEINCNARILRLNIEYTGKNKDEIKKRLEQIKNLENSPVTKKKKSLAELEIMYSNINEQINLYEKYKNDEQKLQKENKNRKKLLNNLNTTIEQNNTLTYLIEPIKTVLKELDSTVSFSQYLIKDETINKLKKQRTILKDEIQKYDSDYELYSFEEKERACILLDNYLKVEQADCSEDLIKKREDIKKCKDKIKELQEADDKVKLSNFSKYITDLYSCVPSKISSIVKEDLQRDSFKIQYQKRGNILQPMIKAKKEDTEIFVNYITGSKARHTLMQLCGYMGFLHLLIKEKQYPLVPIFVGDHLSQSFDDDNVKAIGVILDKAKEDIGKENFQIFLFDDKDYTEMNITPDNAELLYKEDEKGNIVQTGFVPFYFPPNNEVIMTDEK